MFLRFSLCTKSPLPVCMFSCDSFLSGWFVPTINCVAALLAGIAKEPRRTPRHQQTTAVIEFRKSKFVIEYATSFGVLAYGQDFPINVCNKNNCLQQFPDTQNFIDLILWAGSA